MKQKNTTKTYKCKDCKRISDSKQAYPVCPYCGGEKLVYYIEPDKPGIK